MRVLYFTVVHLGSPVNGGSICCRNHVARLAADPGIELVAVTAGPLAWRDAADTFFQGLGVRHHFQAYREWNVRHDANTLRSIAGFAIKAVFQFPWEMQALNQPHIEESIDWAIRNYGIDVLVVDYHQSTLFLKLPRADVRTVLIGLNREGDFYSDQLRLGQTHHGSLTSGISLFRARRWQRKIDAAVDQVITIGPPDLPTHRTRRPPVCITPYLDPKPQRWRASGGKRIFFVGGIAHYPNRVAIEWLTRELAPQLLATGSDGKITIVGATEGDIPEAHRHENLELLGPSDPETLSRLFLTSDLAICPVENDYGVKFKALEALAYGTPLVASRQTMLGLPHLPDVASFDLRQPAEAAALLASLLGDRDRLEAVASAQQQRQSAFIESQHGVWSRTLDKIRG
jgi:glycosyltransferase involved in cell wall biosynthesis